MLVPLKPSVQQTLHCIEFCTCRETTVPLLTTTSVTVPHLGQRTLKCEKLVSCHVDQMSNISSSFRQTVKFMFRESCMMLTGCCASQWQLCDGILTEFENMSIGTVNCLDMCNKHKFSCRSFVFLFSCFLVIIFLAKQCNLHLQVTPNWFHEHATDFLVFLSLMLDLNLTEHV